MATSPPVVLAIAGFDGSGGAGIHADVRAINLNGGYACTVVTAITAQNSRDVLHVEPVPPRVVRSQLDAIFTDFDVAAIKIGLMPSVAVIETVIAAIEENDVWCPIVVDPVLEASAGKSLVDTDVADSLVERLFRIANFITPNIHETSTFAKKAIESLEDAVAAGCELFALGPEYVLITGGHLESEIATDILIGEETVDYFRPEHLAEGTVRGTGCMFSSALAANLAKKIDAYHATINAKTFISRVLNNSSDIGKGTPLTTYGILESLKS